mmetsp:Transcript_10743/g.35642  ORF Transcript_10743/g.35642 Transcript_10743/m.35642 type:complete len:205 (+) Transcript_10743:3541-4155(+)
MPSCMRCCQWSGCPTPSQRSRAHSSTRCPRVGRTSPSASGSCSAWPAPLSAAPCCSHSTRPPPPSTTRPTPCCRPPSAACLPTAPCSPSPTGCTPSWTPRPSCCSRAAHCASTMSRTYSSPIPPPSSRASSQRQAPPPRSCARWPAPPTRAARVRRTGPPRNGSARPVRFFAQPLGLDLHVPAREPHAKAAAAVGWHGSRPLDA